MGHFGIVGILVILMTVLTYFGLDAAGLAKQMHPVAASAQAANTSKAIPNLRLRGRSSRSLP